MSDDANILAGLYGLRQVPPGWVDLVTALALGLLLAALIALALRAFRRRARSNHSDLIEAYRTLPEPQRITALAALLRDLTNRDAPGPGRWTRRAVDRLGIDPGLVAALDETLYRPGPSVTPERLETAIAVAARG